MGKHLFAEGAVALVGALFGNVRRRRVVRSVARERTVLLLPLHAAAVHHLRLRVAEQLEHPERVARPPVVLVAVEHDGGVPGRADPRHQLLEAGARDVVTADLVVQVRRPVHVHRAGDVSGRIEQGVFV